MKVLRPSDLRCPLSGKHAFPTEAAAIRQMHIAWTRPHARRLNSRMPWRVYLCRCGWWHMTSKEKGKADDETW